MSLVSNNCIVGRIYQITGKKYNTPFVWNSIRLKDFITLINEWNTIDLNKINTYFTNNNFGRGVCTTIKLDEKLDIYFTHHLLDDNCKTPTKFYDSDLHYFDILSYVRDKWINRVKRISKENPIFIYDDTNEYTDTDINNLLELSTNYKIILITDKKSLVSEKKNITIIYKNQNNIHTKIMANNLLNNNELKDTLLNSI